MKPVLTFLLPLLLTCFTAHASPAPALDDLMSPDEIAAEVADSSLVTQNIFWGLTASARVVVVVNKARSAQYMTVTVDGQPYARWPVSTGRERWENPPSGRTYFSDTPVGTWTPYSIERDHYSATWGVHMPFAVFITGGIAIHESPPQHVSELGQRASGGCVRLAHQNAQDFYNLVQQYGRENTRISIIEN